MIGVKQLRWGRKIIIIQVIQIQITNTGETNTVGTNNTNSNNTETNNTVGEWMNGVQRVDIDRMNQPTGRLIK
jgi:hypothetical protein